MPAAPMLAALLLLSLTVRGDSLRSEAGDDRIRAVLEFEPARPRLSDEPTLTLTVDCDERLEVTLPPFTDEVGDFVIRNYSEPLPEVKDGRRVYRQVYRLEPVFAGETVIEPIPVRYVDPEQDPAGSILETEPLTVEVVTSHGDAVPELADLRPPAPPLPLPRVTPRWVYYTVGGGLLLLGAAAAALWWWRRRPVPEPVYTPAELAEQEFAALLQNDPLGRGDLKAYYVEVTLIVRRYIERTSGIRAPEQTTAEFLRAMQGSGRIDQDRQASLRAFLESADLVKFAAFEPALHDVKQSFRRAQEFVGLPPREYDTRSVA